VDRTRLFIHWFFSKCAPTPGNFCTPLPQSASPFTSDQLIDMFLVKARPFFPNPLKDIKEMAMWYHSRGFHVVPSSKRVKVVQRGISWSLYQDVQPSFSMIQKWDWSNGIILLGTNHHCFLDIDMKSEKHPDGLENFDENRLKGFCWEHTQSGGYHVFGLGRFGVMKAEPVSIRGRGAYIVTSPTPGYRVIQ